MGHGPVGKANMLGRPKSETELLEIGGADGAYYIYYWSPDGRTLARSFEDGRVVIYDAFSGSTVGEIEAHETEFEGLAFSPSGQYIFTGGIDATAKIWRISTGALIATYEGHVSHPTNGDWSPDGSRIATVSRKYDDSTVRIWDPMTGEEQFVFIDHFWGVTWAKWSPDGSRIASTDRSGQAFIWDVKTGEILLSLYPEEYDFAIWAVAWSPDGEQLATHANDGLLRIWDSHTGEQLIASPGHSALLSTMDWHPDGDRIISGDVDGVIKMFDVRSGDEIFSARPPNSSEMDLSSDGTRFVTCGSSQGGPLKVFAIWGSLEELMDLARECCLLRELTPIERAQFGLPPVETLDD